MSPEYKAGYKAAYSEMMGYANSMVATDPEPEPWLDMAFYAHTSIDEVDNGVDIEDTEGLSF